MTRHSNTLVFGTNTSVGVKVGQDANQTPAIGIGYNRQEAAFVPLLANTKANANSGNLDPCPGTVSGNKLDIESCHFRATHNGDDKDAYSTLASFGGEVGTDTGASGAKANVALAQYFATGIAAQQLALSGGANVVQAGGDTGAKADAAQAAAKAVQTKAELQLAKEKENAVKQSVAVDTAEIGAKSILGKSSDPVTDANLTLLAGKFVGQACSKAELQKLDQRSVKQFLAELRAQKRGCLRVWGNKLKQ